MAAGTAVFSDGVDLYDVHQHVADTNVAGYNAPGPTGTKPNPVHKSSAQISGVATTINDGDVVVVNRRTKVSKVISMATLNASYKYIPS